jgi:hypothetical protein
MTHAQNGETRVKELAASAGKMPVVTATRKRDVVTVAWGDVDEQVNLMIRSARLVVSRQGQEDWTVDLLATGHHSNGRTGYLTTRVKLRPLLEPGDDSLEVSVVLQELNKTRSDETFHFLLGTMTEGAPAAVAPSAATPVVAPLSTAATSPPTSWPALRRSACACEAGATSGSPAAWFLAGAAALATIGRCRCRRRSPLRLNYQGDARHSDPQNPRVCNQPPERAETLLALKPAPDEPGCHLECS